jgi:hypothetical protein
MNETTKSNINLLENFPHIKELVNFSGTQQDYYSKVQASSLFKGRSEKLSQLHNLLLRYSQDLFTLSELQIRKLSEDLSMSYPISSAEHQGSITNPEICNIILNQQMSQNKKVPLLSFACSTVKLENELKSRFFYLGQEKIAVLSASVQNSMVLCAGPFDVKSALVKVKKSCVLAGLRLNERSDFIDWFETLCVGLDEVDAFWKQMTIMNSRLWKHFEKQNDFSIASDYLMFPIELIVRDLICSDLEIGTGHWLLNSLIDPALAKNLESALNGVRSCWNTTNRKGTYLFWYADSKGRAERLILDGNFLRAIDGTFVVRLEREAILQALKNGVLIPAGSLSLLYLVFFLGLDMFGGILQVNYLPEMKDRLLGAVQLALSQLDLEIIRNTRTNLYVNFETRSISSGGLLKFYRGISSKEFDDFRQQNFQKEIEGCLGFLSQLA